jgi:hypothetical protein
MCAHFWLRERSCRHSQQAGREIVQNSKHYSFRSLFESKKVLVLSATLSIKDMVYIE